MPYLSRFSVVLGLLFLLFFTGCGEQQEEFALTLSVTPADAGAVTCVPAQATYPEGTAVTLSAQAASGWRFVRWEGAVEGTETATTTITMTQAETVVAYFVEEEPADTTPPEIVLSGDAEITLECGEIFTDLGATASDNVDGDISARIVVRGDTVDPTKPGVYSLYYEITDAAGNTTTQTRTVTVRDTQAPSLTLLGEAEITLECGDSFAEPGATASDNVDGDLSVAVSILGAIDTQTPGTYTLQYSVSDTAGNSATQTRTVTVQDTQQPAFSLVGGAEITLECGDTFSEPGATATDTCDGDLSARIEISGDTVDVAQPGAYTIQYMVSDTAGNTATQTRKVTVQDTQKPVLSLVGSAEITLECGDVFTDPGVTASDNIDGDLSARVEFSGDVVDSAQPGTYTIRYSVSDTAGNNATQTRMVTVQDTQNPILTLNGDAEITLECGDIFNDPGATATDTCDGDISDRIFARGSAIVTTQAGTHTIQYNVGDLSGNIVTKIRTVVVRDIQKPIISLIGEAEITLECGDTFTDPGATASDSIDGDISTRIVVSGDTVDATQPGTYTRQYEVSNSSGSIAAEKRTIIVQDTGSPVITLLGNDEIILDCGGTFSEPGATASDACAYNLSSSIVITGSVDTNTPDVYTLHYDVTDDAGNSALQKTRTVTVQGPCPDQPIAISCIEDLQKIGNDSSYPLDGEYMLTKNIDASATKNWNDGLGFEPIGEAVIIEFPLGGAPVKYFNGKFDGRGHAISGLHINRPLEEFVGLFAGIKGCIDNLELQNCTISGGRYVGALVGKNAGFVRTCCAINTTVSGNSCAGGLIAFNERTLTRCYTRNTKVSSGIFAGGLASDNRGEVSHCQANSTVSCVGRCAGGLLGDNYGTVSNSCARGAVVANTEVGGLLGSNDGAVSNSYATGTVVGIEDVGGLIGKSYGNGAVTTSFWDIVTSNQSESAGGVGLTTEKMMDMSTFSKAKWDISEDKAKTIWRISDTYSYPFLHYPYEPMQMFSLSIQADHGSVRIRPNMLRHLMHTPVKLTAVPDTGYVFVGWTGKGLGEKVALNINPISLVLTADQDINAIFLPDEDIEINQIEDLQKIGHEPAWPLNWSYLLSQDIDATDTCNWNGGKGFSPIGTGWYPFTGTLEGRGYTVTGLHINRPQEKHVGLIGMLAQNGEIKNLSICNGVTEGGECVGGLVGSNYESTISNSSTSGSVTGISDIGGLVGDNTGALSNCGSAGTVSGVSSVGGLVGNNDENATITDGCASGGVSVSPIYPEDPFSQGGGLVGVNDGIITKSCATGDVNNAGGGLVGLNDGTITKSYATGTTNDGGGGLVCTNSGIIRICFATGAVYGGGGLVGVNMCGEICDSYATGEVYKAGSALGGGLVGFYMSGSISNCYAIGALPNGADPLVPDGKTTACFWDVTLSGQAESSGGGTGLTTAEMMQSAAFINAGWDFETIWGIDEGQSYPFLLEVPEVNED